MGEHRCQRLLRQGEPFASKVFPCAFLCIFIVPWKGSLWGWGNKGSEFPWFPLGYPTSWSHNYILNPGVLSPIPTPPHTYTHTHIKLEHPGFRFSTFVKEKQGTEGNCRLITGKSPGSLKPVGRVGFALQVTACRILSADCSVSICLAGTISCQLPVCQGCYFPRVLFCTSCHFWPGKVSAGQNAFSPSPLWGPEDLLDQTCRDPRSLWIQLAPAVEAETQTASSDDVPEGEKSRETHSKKRPKTAAAFSTARGAGHQLGLRTCLPSCLDCFEASQDLPVVAPVFNSCLLRQVSQGLPPAPCTLLAAKQTVFPS